ncbi:hypothetical protein SAMN05192561_1034 [Halopenitus malekzadehii]|uniref:DUF8135 domain-containing protein n=1 Tax=Halopenitus malekzadehii TaxID=1267564 RepID=A0A1H6IRA7_9EURY|nr:hypothetical protein [Halopenitus malekzadehii]SEH48908.1 hypothetical protein SAMN05192561_1034 [Halopenitus malekzadehii]
MSEDGSAEPGDEPESTEPAEPAEPNGTDTSTDEATEIDPIDLSEYGTDRYRAGTDGTETDDSGPDRSAADPADTTGRGRDELDRMVDELAIDADPTDADPADVDPADTAADDPFEAMDVDVGEVDVWGTLETDDLGSVESAPPTESALDAESGPRPNAATDFADDAGEFGESPEYDDRVVDKREYCQRCPHSTDPPTMACTHEGTQIVEVIEMDRFRVRNCPMVSTDGPMFDRVNE